MGDLCRICMLPSGAIDIHNNIIDGKLLVDFLTEVASINREVSQKFKLICNNCCFSIGLFSDFRQKILNAEKVLTEMCFQTMKTEDVEIKDENVFINSNSIEESDNREQTPNINNDDNSMEESRDNVELNDVNKNNSNITFFIHPIASNTIIQDTNNTHLLCSTPNNIININTNSVNIPTDEINKQNVTDNTTPEDDLNASLSDDSSAKKRYSCRLCDKKFTKLGSLNSHRKLTHNESKSTCYICGEVYKRKLKMYAHMNEKHNNGIFACWDCNTILPNSWALKQHRENDHNDDKNAENKCIPCGLSFETWREYVSHMSGHLQKSFICKICSKAFTSKALLSNHEVVHSDKREYSCEKCDKSYKTQSTLRTHVNNVHAENNCPCDVCGSVFKSYLYLRRHQKIHTDSYKVQCEICGVNLTTSAMRTHMNNHLGKRPFKCDTCEKSFSHANLLKEHKLIHEGIKPFLCSICGNSFRTKATYYKHKLVHTGERRHECTICKKRFPLPHHLKLHMKTH